MSTLIRWGGGGLALLAGDLLAGTIDSSRYKGLTNTTTFSLFSDLGL